MRVSSKAFRQLHTKKDWSSRAKMEEKERARAPHLHESGQLCASMAWMWHTHGQLQALVVRRAMNSETRLFCLHTCSRVWRRLCWKTPVPFSFFFSEPNPTLKCASSRFLRNMRSYVEAARCLGGDTLSTRAAWPDEPLRVLRSIWRCQMSSALADRLRLMKWLVNWGRSEVSLSFHMYPLRCSWPFDLWKYFFFFQNSNMSLDVQPTASKLEYIILKSCRLFSKHIWHTLTPRFFPPGTLQIVSDTIGPTRKTRTLNVSGEFVADSRRPHNSQQ